MFFQNEDNPKKLGKNREAMFRITGNKNEKEVVNIILYKLNSRYGDEEIIRSFLASVRKHRREVFLYLEIRRWKRPQTLQNSTSQSSHGCLSTGSRRRRDC